MCVVWARLCLNEMTQGQRLVLLISGRQPWSHRTDLRVSQPVLRAGCHRHDVKQPRAWQAQVTAPVESAVIRSKWDSVRQVPGSKQALNKWKLLLLLLLNCIISVMRELADAVCGRGSREDLLENGYMWAKTLPGWFFFFCGKWTLENLMKPVDLLSRKRHICSDDDLCIIPGTSQTPGGLSSHGNWLDTAVICQAWLRKEPTLISPYYSKWKTSPHIISFFNFLKLIFLGV